MTDESDQGGQIDETPYQPPGETTPGYRPGQPRTAADETDQGSFAGTPSFGDDDPERVAEEVQSGGSPSVVDERD